MSGHIDFLVLYGNVGKHLLSYMPRSALACDPDKAGLKAAGIFACRIPFGRTEGSLSFYEFRRKQAPTPTAGQTPQTKALHDKRTALPGKPPRPFGPSMQLLDHRRPASALQQRFGGNAPLQLMPKSVVTMLTNTNLEVEPTFIAKGNAKFRITKFEASRFHVENVKRWLSAEEDKNLELTEEEIEGYEFVKMNEPGNPIEGTTDLYSVDELGKTGDEFAHVSEYGKSKIKDVTADRDVAWRSIVDHEKLPPPLASELTTDEEKYLSSQLLATQMIKSLMGILNAQEDEKVDEIPVAKEGAAESEISSSPVNEKTQTWLQNAPVDFLAHDKSIERQEAKGNNVDLTKHVAIVDESSKAEFHEKVKIAAELLNAIFSGIAPSFSPPAIFVHPIRGTRAWANGDAPEIDICISDPVEIIVHEVGHYIESKSHDLQDNVHGLIKMRRDKDYGPYKMRGKEFNDDEIRWKGKYPVTGQYTSKIYPTQKGDYKPATEVTSLTLEKLATSPSSLMAMVEGDPLQVLKVLGPIARMSAGEKQEIAVLEKWVENRNMVSFLRLVAYEYMDEIKDTAYEEDGELTLDELNKLFIKIGNDDIDAEIEALNIMDCFKGLHAKMLAWKDL
ncbi:MAG: hypothetical protein ACOVN0_05005 [Niveispirillum sp.]|uniref:hypothetical protein n=1 Tax=Niveispirillum sp. TaxID=1917217 RepID=UPI003BA6010E